jgi:hypothetical protein
VDELGQQLALAALPGGDPFARRSVQGAEVLLYLAEVRQQLAGGGGELLVALADRGAVQQAGVRILAELVDLALDVLLAALELVQALGGVGLGALGWQIGLVGTPSPAIRCVISQHRGHRISSLR